MAKRRKHRLHGLGAAAEKSNAPAVLGTLSGLAAVGALAAWWLCRGACAAPRRVAIPPPLITSNALPGLPEEKVVPALSPTAASPGVTPALVATVSTSAATTAPGIAYTMKAGEQLWTVAQTLYGDARLWPAIFDANRNRFSNPDTIPVGTILNVPTRRSIKPAAEAAYQRRADEHSRIWDAHRKARKPGTPVLPASVLNPTT